jgi:exodeoxyribonuclease-3
MLNIATWNINSINAHLEQTLAFLRDNSNDILMLQETKCIEENFPKDEFLHYNIAVCGQKSYNGVAILSKFPIEDVKYDFPDNPCSNEARFIEVDSLTPLGLIKIINVYVPNGSELTSPKFATKLVFLKSLKHYLSTLDSAQSIIIGGDFNVAPFDIDVYDAKQMQDCLLCSVSEKSSLRAILNSNFFDLYRLGNPRAKEFSWWDYRANSFERDLGLRIDFLLANPLLSNMLITAQIHKSARQIPVKCSDHVPVAATFA